MGKRNDWLYSAGSFASGLPAAVFSTFIMFFYVDYLKMPAKLIGIGMAIYGVWNAINDPLFGQISDKTRTRFGRRIPYVLFGSIPLAVAFVLVWTPPVGWHGNTTLMFVYFMVAIFLYDTFYTMVILNWTAMFPEMYKTQKERTRVSAIRQILGVLGTLVGTALPPILYVKIGWTAVGVLFAVFTLISLGLSLLGSKEDPSFVEAESLPFFKALIATIFNGSFITFVLGYTLIQFTFVMLQTMLPFFSKYVLGFEGFKVSIMLGSIFIVAMALVAVWARIANRRGSKNTILISLILFGLAFIPFLFIKGFTGGLITSLLLGIGLAGVILLIDVFISDIVDEDELKTGVRREGMYFGINALFIRLAISAQSLIMGFVLSSSGYNANLGIGQQPHSALTGMRILICVFPIAAIVLSIIFFKLYPLDGDRLKNVKKQVEIIHTKDSNLTM